MSGVKDEMLIRVALEEAKKAIGQTSPNPAVGAVLARGEGVIASGFHRRAGSPHAEIDCLQKVNGRPPRGATLYVTLEPCSTTGRTPPCTEAIIASGVKTVVIGAIDPNPRHAGRGIEILRAAGLVVRSGVLADDCAAINRPFNKWIATGRPYVIAKCGMTLDGRLTQPPGEPRWITTSAARLHANRRRALVDAILVGAETVRADNPRLTVRQTPGARQPWRVLLSRSGRLPASAHLFTDAHAERTLVFRQTAPETLLDNLGQRQVTSLLIEGGGEVLAQMLDGRLVDAVDLYFGGVISGGPVLAFGGRGAGCTQEGLKLVEPTYELIGQDLFMSARVASAARG